MAIYYMYSDLTRERVAVSLVRCLFYFYQRDQTIYMRNTM